MHTKEVENRKNSNIQLNTMPKRITAIVVAGVALYFDHSYSDVIFPSTKIITNAIKQLQAQGFAVLWIDVLSKVYGQATK